MSIILASGNFDTAPMMLDITDVVARSACLEKALVTYGVRFPVTCCWRELRKKTRNILHSN